MRTCTQSGIRGSTNMFVMIGWEDNVIQWSSMVMIIFLLYHITMNIKKSFQTIYLTQSFWPHIILKDDAGNNWSHDIPDVVYDPESPYSLLGIPFLGKYFTKNDSANEFGNEPWIQSASTN